MNKYMQYGAILVSLTVIGIVIYNKNRKGFEESIKNASDKLDLTGRFPLKLGSEGIEVRNLQVMLGLPITGKFDKTVEDKLILKTKMNMLHKASYDNWMASLKKLNLGYQFFE